VSRHLRVPGSSNPAANPSFAHVAESRRTFLRAGVGVAALGALASCVAQTPRPQLGFMPIAPSTEDALRVPSGYEASVLLRWGDPIGHVEGSPPFRMDGSNSAGEQALQAGMHHDGMHYFPLQGSSRGLLAINHEYMDHGLLFADGMRGWSAEKVAKSQSAVGVTIVEAALQDGQWQIVRPSRYARRITARTGCRLAGPAAGHALVRTAADPEGRQVIGTHSNCAHGWTPWGTYLTCEENFWFQFVQRGRLTGREERYGLRTRDATRWAEYDERWDSARHPNEINRFGWVVEIDPYDPGSPPVKRTALGRFWHEGAACAVAPDRRLAFYMGDDSAFEHVFKFVTARPYDPSNRAGNRDLLDAGTLYAARFNADGSGDWLPLAHGEGPLTAANGFRDQGEVLIYARLAADALGATRMDRPEWIVPHPRTREVYCALSNNVARGNGGYEGPNPANPRANNAFGQILRWRETGGDPGARRFQWDIFVQAGDPANPDANKKGNIQGDLFGSPDGLWIDERGILWVQTDASTRAILRGEYSGIGNNQVLAADPATGIFRRFLTGPRGSEITGFHLTPDSRTAFVNIQHPGEGATSDNPRGLSNWPDYAPDGRPRSATVVIRRKDGGIIGT
jgi:secreted PhoX family phosphatase